MLKEIAIKLRSMQLFYQSAHNLSKGTTFYQDHDAFGDYYGAVSSDYDSVIERAITLEGDSSADLKYQLKGIYSCIKDMPTCNSNEDFFREGWRYEKELCDMIEKHVKKGCSVGVEQLIGDIADKSEGRQYLISRRLKSSGKAVVSKKSK